MECLINDTNLLMSNFVSFLYTLSSGNNR